VRRRGLLVLAVAAGFAAFGASQAGAGGNNFKVGDGVHPCKDAHYNDPAGIQMAVNDAKPGQKITVCAGSYTSVVVATAKLNIQGANPDLSKVSACTSATTYDDPATYSVVTGGAGPDGFSITA